MKMVCKFCGMPVIADSGIYNLGYRHDILITNVYCKYFGYQAKAITEDEYKIQQVVKQLTK